MGSSEAVWRILEHPISEHFSHVVGLAVHLENGQRIFFNAANALERAQRPPPANTLTAFFDLCVYDDFAKTLKYHAVLEYYTWNKSSKKWTRRRQGGMVVRGCFTVHKASAIGRMYSINPRQGDSYYVRLFLTEICGPTSFNALRNVDSAELSFREACLARGLLGNDQHLHLAMNEAGFSQSASNIRSPVGHYFNQLLPQQSTYTLGRVSLTIIGRLPVPAPSPYWQPWWWLQWWGIQLGTLWTWGQGVAYGQPWYQFVWPSNTTERCRWAVGKGVLQGGRLWQREVGSPSQRSPGTPNCWPA